MNIGLTQLFVGDIHIVDDDDDYSPLIKIQFCNDFQRLLTMEQKMEIGKQFFKSLDNYDLTIKKEGD